MKPSWSLTTKSYLIVAPVVCTFLLFATTTVHSLWKLHRCVAAVEQASANGISSSRLAKLSERYQTDYWDLVASGNTSEEQQLTDGAAQIAGVLARESTQNLQVLVQRFSESFALVRPSVAGQARLLANPQTRSASIDHGKQAGIMLADSMRPAKLLAHENDQLVRRDVATLIATSEASFAERSPITQSAQRMAVEAEEGVLIGRMLLRVAEEQTAFARHSALRGPSVTTDAELNDIHAQAVEVIETLKRNQRAHADEGAGKLVELIGRDYELFQSINTQLADAAGELSETSRAEMQESLESWLETMNGHLDELAELQANHLRKASSELRTSLRRTEVIVGGVIGGFLLIVAGVPYILMSKIVAPIRRLARAMNLFSRGDLNVKVPVTSSDEVGELAIGFNSMTNELAESIAKRRQAEESVRDREDKLSLLLSSTAEAIYGIDLDGRCTFCNPSCVQVLGYQSAKDLLGKNMHNLIHHSRSNGTPIPVAECQIYQAFTIGKQIHVDDEVLWRADGTSFPAEYWSYPQKKNGEVVGAVVTFLDITTRRQAEATITHQAYYDALTSLPNRLLLEDRLEKALARARRHQEKVAILFLDLDGFKVINDSLGHSVGDVLLKQVAGRLQTCAREQDTVARLGGDEFIVLLTSVKEVADVGVAANRILQSLTEEFIVLEHSLNVSCSMGVSIFPDHAVETISLVKHADTAMYRAKENGRNSIQFFTADMNADVHERLMLENSLRRALERGELFLMYQPQVDITSGKIIGVEALLRWRHPELGLVPPDKFIPIAENSGLIVPIGEWVLRTACTQVRRWHDAGLPNMPVAVNVSAVQFRQSGFVNLIETVLADTGLPPEYLELELTESVILSNAEISGSMFSGLHGLGVRLSIDDFGTGYSNLSYLRHFPVSKLKIDRSFIRDLAVDRDDAAITSAIIGMAKNLGLKVVAEGVEDQRQLDFLKDHNCDEAQGFLFSKPVLAENISCLAIPNLSYAKSS